MGASQSTSQSSRQANTEKLMEAVMTGGEVSKKREAELQKAANYGRGVKFIEASPTVKGLTQYRRDAKGNVIIDPNTGKPETKAVLRTGVTAQDYTGRVVANEPTLRELGGDIARGLVGGQAPDPGFTGKYSQYTPKPEPVKGLIPTIADVAMSGGFSPAVQLLRSGVSFFQNRDDKKDQPVQKTTETAQPSDIVENNRKVRLEKLASSLASGGADKRPFLTLKTRGFGGTMK